MSDVKEIDVKRAAKSIAKMVDEYTQRGWNEEGLSSFAMIVERRMRRFAPTPATQPQGQQNEGAES